jgi:hypothetical protein
MKEAQKRLKDSSNTSSGFIIQEEALWRWGIQQSQNPTAAYRLGVDIGEESGREILLDREFFWSGVNDS